MSAVINDLMKILEDCVRWRLNTEFNRNLADSPLYQLQINEHDFLGQFIVENKLRHEEIILLMLALIPHIHPSFFQNLIGEYFPNGGEFPEFGGVKGTNHRGILPTGETALYLLAGTDTNKRVQMAGLFDPEQTLFHKGVLRLGSAPDGEPRFSGRLLLDDEYADLFTTGKVVKPQLSGDFPAELITTGLDWSELVLPTTTMDGIREIETWLQFNEQLMADWELKGRVKPGFRVLFFGPPGTGKTMAACLLGKYTSRDVYRVDLSMVVSKYIGETEKNLSKLFDKAANKDWILFFDEADSIFGKRTGVRDAHDKYANQEVSYLLQRIETHPGLIILASNLKSNIDSSFTRRFNATIEFPNPGIDERKRLWETYFPAHVEKARDFSFADLARRFDLSGANIVNVVQFAGLQSLKQNRPVIQRDDLLRGIYKEYQKEGKMIRRE
ncbi:MAG: ATP-binding protein [Mangrovibacterium sp.]